MPSGFESHAFRLYPDGETDITPRFERGIPGSTPGRGTPMPLAALQDWSTEGQPDWRRDPVGSRSSFRALRVQLPLLPLIAGLDGWCVWCKGSTRPCEGHGGGFKSPHAPLVTIAKPQAVCGHKSVLLGGDSGSNPDGVGSNPTALASLVFLSWWCNGSASDPPKVQIRVRIPAGILSSGQWTVDSGQLRRLVFRY
jgi:hypothetical protein